MINEWNNKIAEITGFAKSDAFDTIFVEKFIQPHQQEAMRAVMSDALDGRGVSNFELEFYTKSNELRHLLINATTRRDELMNVIGVFGVAQDVTESVQRDKAVAGMALDLRQLIDTANAPIFGIDVDLNVNEWNRRTEIITGYTKDEVMDEPLVERFIAHDNRERVEAVLRDALKGNETSNYELEFLTKCGQRRLMLVNATARRGPASEVLGGEFPLELATMSYHSDFLILQDLLTVVGVAQDVTEERRNAEELQKMQYLQATQAAKVETERNMTAYFAHELRNPLSAIDSALTAMSDDIPEPAKELVSGMRECSSFMSSILGNLLDVRKLEEKKLTLKSAPVSLNGLLNSVYNMLHASVKPGVEFRVEHCPEGQEWVLSDGHRIQQVITNVVTNAIKYTISGSVTMRIGWNGANVQFDCIDTGPGIPKSDQEKLFQRFVQRGGAPGTGLGLAIAKHIVDLTNGSIQFHSDPTVRPGTTCTVIMPLRKCPQESAEPTTDTQSVFGEAMSFLIVDDVKLNRTMLKHRIKKGIAPQCVITEASTGEEALAICENHSFDVIIVDQYMNEAGGVMVGTDVVYAMRRMKIKSVIVGCSGNDLDKEFTEAGADMVWKKPMPTNSQIISNLRELLGSS